MEREKSVGGGYGFGGALVGIVSLIIQHNVYERLQMSLEPKLIQFQPNEIMSGGLQHYLELTNASFTAEISEV
ncbi:hypothetical protein MYX76_16735 [Desulfobacterota bacterium AH_259_B03_O07]|nr:hypothetical protein [Desulfobacterota bacterium AH_259_B03_O07]